ncbi:MAG: phosphoribosylaminoimidazolesuccinocarboxamide synthase [Planctomycetota bacterium]|nr:phosphoribosylaminoimidazolesuccinocarboxamide synthase [Planctomycetota bacterium]
MANGFEAPVGGDSYHRGVKALETTNLRLGGRRSGKVRDTYDLPGEAGSPARLLVVATDRLSAFDVVLPTPIPGKGRLLTELSANWLRWIEGRGLARTYLMSTDAGDVPGLNVEERAALEGRCTIGRKCRVVPIECVARGYLAGSGWKDYQATGEVCGVALPKGLRNAERLPEPIFTPATKAEQGEHDENISFERACDVAGRAVMERLREMTLRIYSAAAAYALERGVIIADTKFEFGYPLGEAETPENLMLIDEALTPDSSRFWPAAGHEPGREPASFDKQYVRNYLLELVAAGKWDKTAPGPTLPEDVVRNTLARYEEARRLLFG